MIKPHCGLRLPPDRYCLVAPNYKLRATEIPPKKLAKSALDRSANRFKTGLSHVKRPTQQAVVKTQNVTIPKPVFKFTISETAKSPTNAEGEQVPGKSGQLVKAQPGVSLTPKQKTQQQQQKHQIKILKTAQPSQSQPPIITSTQSPLLTTIKLEPDSIKMEIDDEQNNYPEGSLKRKRNEHTI